MRFCATFSMLAADTSESPGLSSSGNFAVSEKSASRMRVSYPLARSVGGFTIDPLRMRFLASFLVVFFSAAVTSSSATSAPSRGLGSTEATLVGPTT